MSVTSESMATADLAPQPPMCSFHRRGGSKVGELIREERIQPQIARIRFRRRLFRLSVRFTFDEKIEDGDFCVENHGVQLLVDPMSAST